MRAASRDEPGTPVVIYEFDDGSCVAKFGDGYDDPWPEGAVRRSFFPHATIEELDAP